MAIQVRNLSDLIWQQAIYGDGLFGATISLEGGDKVIKELRRYDSQTHTVLLEFEDGDVIELSDKIPYEINTVRPDSKPNKKRKNKKKK